MAVAGYVLCVCSMPPEPPASQISKIKGSKGSLTVWRNPSAPHRYEKLHRWVEDELSQWTSASDPAIRWSTAERVVRKLLWLQSGSSSLLRDIVTNT